MRFEHTIEVYCTGRSEWGMSHPTTKMDCLGNFSLRGAGAAITSIGYECPFCHKKLMAVDELCSPSQAMLDEIDSVE